MLCVMFSEENVNADCSVEVVSMMFWCWRYSYVVARAFLGDRLQAQVKEPTPSEILIPGDVV